MYRWPDFNAAEQVVVLYIDRYLQPLDIDAPEEEFRMRSSQRWAAEELLSFLNAHWFEDVPVELIADYIDDCRYRAEKYRDTSMGPVYSTAFETAQEMMLLFV